MVTDKELETVIDEVLNILVEYLSQQHLERNSPVYLRQDIQDRLDYAIYIANKSKLTGSTTVMKKR